jgi:hypothetical protein
VTLNLCLRSIAIQPPSSNGNISFLFDRRAGPPSRALGNTRCRAPGSKISDACNFRSEQGELSGVCRSGHLRRVGNPLADHRHILNLADSITGMSPTQVPANGIVACGPGTHRLSASRCMSWPVSIFDLSVVGHSQANPRCSTTFRLPVGAPQLVKEPKPTRVAKPPVDGPKV